MLGFMPCDDLRGGMGGVGVRLKKVGIHIYIRRVHTLYNRN